VWVAGEPVLAREKLGEFAHGMREAMKEIWA
jgi:hypothetical protein